MDIYMSTNRASLAKGAVASGTGSPVNALIDDTEVTHWTGVAPVNVQQVTVDLQNGVQNVKRVNVSAMGNPTSPGRFKLSVSSRSRPARRESRSTCALPADFTTIYTSRSKLPRRRPATAPT